MYLSKKQKIASPIINAAGHLRFLDAYSILKKYFGSKIVILTYHRIGPNNNAWLYPPTSASDFEKQMKYLKKTNKIIPLNKLAERIREGKTLEEKIAVVTLDDGYKDNYLYAFPILKKYNIPATIFLVTGHINTGNLFWFDKVRYLICNTKLKRFKLEGLGDFSLYSMKDRLKSYFIITEKLKKISDEKKNDLLEKLVNIFNIDIPYDLGRDVNLSWEEVKEMSESGVEFGAHTVTHPILTRIPLDKARFEILHSRKDLEKRLNQNTYTFCYPNGSIEDFNNEIIEIVKNSGYSCAVTTISIINYSKTNLFKLGRLFDPWSYNSLVLDCILMQQIY
jgi:peptidoglycan/xylan/chitin deacetylase (PgdA/CDA1 family)